MIVIVLIAAVAAAALLAAFALGTTQTAPTPDEQFLAIVTERDAFATTHEPDLRVIRELGRAVCRALDNQVPAEFIVQTTADEDFYDVGDARVLVRAATESYCPEHQSP